MKVSLINLTLVVAVLALTGLATWWMDGHHGSAVVSAPTITQNTAPSDSKAEVRAPGTMLRNLAGEKVALHNYEGKIILLNFWATWCTPCIAEWPQFIALAQAMPDDVVILAVSIDDEKEKITSFLRRYAPTYTQQKNIYLFHDADKSVSQDLFQTVRVPETIIITPDMIMARKVAGLSLKWDSEDTITYLRGLKAD